VVVLPGFLASDLSTVVLRRFLRTLGHRAVGWGLGRNTGRVPELQAAMLESLPGFVEANGGPVNLVGWSLGGYIAREVARDRPGSVRQVVTLGSPVVGGPKYTRAADYYRRQGVDLDALEDEIAARDEVPLQVPVTALYTRSDAIVAWEACIDRVNDGVEHQEVKTTHVGLGFNPEVLCRIARALAV
jgi:pimeloyl-ACP methyl ester carboxylesterase